MKSKNWILLTLIPMVGLSGCASVNNVMHILTYGTPAPGHPGYVLPDPYPTYYGGYVPDTSPPDTNPPDYGTGTSSYGKAPNDGKHRAGPGSSCPLGTTC